MKKVFTDPEIEMVRFESMEVVCGSPTDGDPWGLPGDDGEEP